MLPAHSGLKSSSERRSSFKDSFFARNDRLSLSDRIAGICVIACSAIMMGMLISFALWL